MKCFEFLKKKIKDYGDLERWYAEDKCPQESREYRIKKEILMDLNVCLRLLVEELKKEAEEK